jgi:hypothetical protein
MITNVHHDIQELFSGSPSCVKMYHGYFLAGRSPFALEGMHLETSIELLIQ